MKSLQIKDLPENIYYKLTELAKVERRSLAQQAIAILAKGLELNENQKMKRVNFLEALKNNKNISLINVNSQIPNAVDLIREDRDR